MSNAKKCDRCGTLYEEDFDNRPMIIKNFKIFGLATLNCNYNNIMQFDLCPECANEFANFMDKKEV